MRGAIMLGLMLAVQSAVSAGPLRVGAAAVVITPAPGTAMAGYFDERLVQGVDDDLYAKALVLEQDGSKAALVACDLVEMPRPIAEQARKLIEKSTGIAPDHVMISATHTHTGPVLPVHGYIDQARGWHLDEAEKYVVTLPALIAHSVEAANAKLGPARAFVGVGREENLAFNRRYFMKDGTVGWNPGKLNPNIVKPAGPTDPRVPVVYFESPDHKPLASYTNFAMHLDTTGGNLVSADYPFTLHQSLARVKGPDMVSLFTIGTAGNINHVDVSWSDPQHGPSEAARIGTILAADVLKTLRHVEPLKGSGIRCASRIVTLEWAPITDADIQQARKTAVKFGKDRPTFLERVKAFKVLDIQSRNSKPLQAEVQVIALGDDVAWIGLPGEIFVELGLSIQQHSPFAHTIIAELANGNLGYVPNRDAYPQGNYEVVNSRCAEGSGEKLAETAIDLLKQLRPDNSR
jgi:hypothetical protein